MRKTFAALAVIGMAASGASIVQAQSPTPASAASFPAWAYPWVPDFKVAPADDVPRLRVEREAVEVRQRARRHKSPPPLY